VPLVDLFEDVADGVRAAAGDPDHDERP